tara:strand:+ start:37 stop:195 length:159 start_codon:yes stop_codon:yes gene_type:complete
MFITFETSLGRFLHGLLFRWAKDAPERQIPAEDMPQKSEHREIFDPWKNVRI